MGLFQQINFQAGRGRLQFLVIGGLAVNLHGYSRDTADLDLLILRDVHQQWLDLFFGLGYSLFQKKDAFIQLSPPRQGEWPVDLMMVQQATFQSMYQHGKAVELYGEQISVPALEHLIALKLHALKHTHAGRFLKDFLDVENLVRVNKIDVQSASVRELFLKYGTADLYEKVSKACGR